MARQRPVRYVPPPPIDWGDPLRLRKAEPVPVRAPDPGNLPLRQRMLPPEPVYVAPPPAPPVIEEPDPEPSLRLLPMFPPSRPAPPQEEDVAEARSRRVARRAAAQAAAAQAAAEQEAAAQAAAEQAKVKRGLRRAQEAARAAAEAEARAERGRRRAAAAAAAAAAEADARARRARRRAIAAEAKAAAQEAAEEKRKERLRAIEAAEAKAAEAKARRVQRRAARALRTMNTEPTVRPARRASKQPVAFINPNNLLIWVHTWHGKDRYRAATIRSLDESDAVGRYEVIRQPPGADRDVFYMNTLREICARNDIMWMLRLEDDVVVNKNLVYNTCRWAAVRSHSFGAGWLSVTHDMLNDSAHCGTLDGFRTREYPEAHFAGGVLMKTSLVQELLPSIRRRLVLGEYREGMDVPPSHPLRLQVPGGKRKPQRFAPGCALSNAVWRAGLRVFFHVPSIVSIDMSIPAYHGPMRTRWTQPYDSSWKVHPR